MGIPCPSCTHLASPQGHRQTPPDAHPERRGTTQGSCSRPEWCRVDIRAEGEDTSPHGHRQASLPCDGKCRPCWNQALVGSHSRQGQGNTPPLPTGFLRHRVPVAILVGHVTMAGCKLRAQNHAPATEMYARRPSIGGSDDCAGSARPSSHTAPRRSGTP